MRMFVFFVVGEISVLCVVKVVFEKNEYVKMENFFVFAKLGLVWYEFFVCKNNKRRLYMGYSLPSNRVY